MNISDGYRFVVTSPKWLSRCLVTWYQSTNWATYMRWNALVRHQTRFSSSQLRLYSEKPSMWPSKVVIWQDCLKTYPPNLAPTQHGWYHHENNTILFPTSGLLVYSNSLIVAAAAKNHVPARSVAYDYIHVATTKIEFVNNHPGTCIDVWWFKDVMNLYIMSLTLAIIWLIYHISNSS